jgi:hypothetical protein|tara:strand:+ start:176 stop:511 length:336 start_codon:yes stop_codon:yes gene_type:complete
MIKLIIAASFLFLFTTNAIAEPRMFLSQVTCNSDSQLPFDIVEEKHGEQRVAMGKMAIMDARTKRIHTIDMVLTINMESRTYTIIGIFADGTGCIIGSGKDFASYLEGPSI